MKSRKTTLIAAVAMLALAGAACTKKVAAVKPPAPPAPAAPTVSTPTPQPAASSRTETTPTASTPTPRYPDAKTRARIEELLARISDAYFDYNKSALRQDALSTLQSDSTELRNILAQYPDYNLQIEGYCDERGSAEYNLALGERRAQAAKEYLVGVGIPSGQLSTVSYGKERQICQDHEETCWQKNRRVHIIAMAK